MNTGKTTKDFQYSHTLQFNTETHYLPHSENEFAPTEYEGSY